MTTDANTSFAVRLEKALTKANYPTGRGRRVRLAADTGVTGEAARKWLTGENLPGLKNARKIAALSGVDVDWLLTGRDSQTPGGHISTWEHPEDLPPDQYVLIPRRRVALSAGNGRLIFEEEEAPPIPLPTAIVRRLGLRAADAVLVYADGDSMEPGICDGDLLLVDLAARDVREGAIYALRYADQLRVKRLFRRYDGGLILRSDNAARYPDEAVPPEHQDGHVAIIGRVIWRGGAL